MWKKLWFSKMYRDKSKDRVLCSTCQNIFDKDQTVHVRHLCCTVVFCLACYSKYKPSKLGKENIC